MEQQQLLAFCSSFPDAVIDHPFADGGFLVARHGGNRKWFALVFELEGQLAVNLKQEPMKSDLLRACYANIRPAWHMNKVHWNTIFPEGLPDSLVEEMVADSHRLTR